MYLLFDDWHWNTLKNRHFDWITRGTKLMDYSCRRIFDPYGFFRGKEISPWPEILTRSCQFTTKDRQSLAYFRVIHQFHKLNRIRVLFRQLKTSQTLWHFFDELPFTYTPRNAIMSRLFQNFKNSSWKISRNSKLKVNYSTKLNVFNKFYYLVTYC